jgi:predicted NBD/HSP70 family sugar kinase
LGKLDADNFISGNHKIVRNINRSAILNLVREKQPVSRAVLSKMSDLNKSTVSSIVLDLLEGKLIYETCNGESTGGRKPILLQLSRQDFFIGAIDFDPNYTYIAIGDIEANILEKKTIKTLNNHPEDFIRTCLLELLELKAGLGCPNLKSIGISVPGIVDAEIGKVFVAPDLGWKNISINKICKEIISKSHSESVIVENEANSSALAEQWFGNALENNSNMVFISEGIGTGVIFDGKLVSGSYNLAGQFGHTTIEAEGRLCVCGNRGCWELYASNHATVQRFYTLKKKPFDGSPILEMQKIIAAALDGDEDAISAIRETGRYLGIGISNIIKGIDPEIVILGGIITTAWYLIYPEIIKEIRSRVFFELNESRKVIPTSLKERSSLVGAFTLAIKEIFSGYKITI